ncbi:MAG: hypothetical protein KatS3mg117_2631 [Geminicoccaceae bacterium]|nr:MAG: hypothetical protein KatS3mg117_2631 [Geminicoccaceae bacterium]
MATETFPEAVAIPNTAGIRMRAFGSARKRRPWMRCGFERGSPVLAVCRDRILGTVRRCIEPASEGTSRGHPAVAPAGLASDDEARANLCEAGLSGRRARGGRTVEIVLLPFEPDTGRVRSERGRPGRSIQPPPIARKHVFRRDPAVELAPCRSIRMLPSAPFRQCRVGRRADRARPVRYGTQRARFVVVTPSGRAGALARREGSERVASGQPARPVRAARSAAVHPQIRPTIARSAADAGTASALSGRSRVERRLHSVPLAGSGGVPPCFVVATARCRADEEIRREILEPRSHGR